jgi:hypothetical protein
MTALAEFDDLVLTMRRDLSSSEKPRAVHLLNVASERVRTFTGLTFTAETTTTRVRVRNGLARLPQRPVTAVSAVVDMDGNAVNFEWYAGQVVDCKPVMLNVFEINLCRTTPQWVDVTYTHGYNPIPADVVGIVCDLAAAALDSPPEESGVQSETWSDYSITTGSQFPGGVRLTQSMKDSLTPYMSPAGTVSVR